MLLSSHVVAVHAAAREGARTQGALGLRRRGPAARRPRVPPAARVGAPVAAHRRPAEARAVGRRPAGAARATEVEEYEDPGAANVILTNGARLYVDHAHPEYSSPEVTNPLDAVRWDRAGERVMLASVRALASTPALPDVTLYKNNVDGKGATYGTHENYLVDRAVPFSDLAARLIPFFVTRQVFTGAGRVGPRAARRGAGVPAVAARGLHRGRGRPGDHAAPPDRQHPRRAARRPGRAGAGCTSSSATRRCSRRRRTCASAPRRSCCGSSSGRSPRAAPGRRWRAIDRLALRDPVHAVHVVSHDLTLEHAGSSWPTGAG